MGLRDWIVEKLNPAQDVIATSEGDAIGSSSNITIAEAHSTIEAVNRGANMLIDACSGLDYDVKGLIGGTAKVRAKAIAKLLNFAPNPYQSAVDFRKAIFSDFIFEGMAFIYWDGGFIYHLPAQQVEILTDKKTFIAGYTYNGQTNFKESEVFSFKDVSSTSIYRGTSRLDSAKKSITTISSMLDMQGRFFDNGASFGLMLTTDNTLSNAAKERTILHYLQKYNPRRGGRRPVIFDNGLKPHSVANNTFKDMDFDVSIKTHGEKILQALGVPPILLAGGNNANISPNLRLMYLETVLPIVRGYTSALERFFGYDIEPITSNVSALQPEIKEIAGFNATLVNGGIITPNEARANLRLPPIEGEENDTLRIPANITGSAADPSQGGKPAEEES
jgi:HK97 family phage portal protein